METDSSAPSQPFLTSQLTCCAVESWVTLVLFRGARNAPRLRIDAAGGKIQAALLDPTLLVSPFHVLAAVNKAVVSKEQQLMKTRNIFSEIIFNLSPSNNISDSFKKFGIKDSSQNILAVLLHDTRDCPQVEDLMSSVEGEVVSLDLLAIFHDEDAIQKIPSWFALWNNYGKRPFRLYKILPEERAISSLENSAVTRMVIKDVT